MIIVALLNVASYSIGVVLDLSQSVFFALGMAAGALLMGFLLNYFVPLIDKSKNYRVGAEGEEKVSDYLVDHLNGKNIIVSDLFLKNGSGNIDQVIIGDHGVFVVETKNFRGSFVVDGDQWILNTGKGTINKKSPGKQIKRNSCELRDFFEKDFVKLKDVYIHNVVMVVDPSVKIKVIREPQHYLIFTSIEELVDFINCRMIFRKIHDRNSDTSNIEMNTDNYGKLEKIFLKLNAKVKYSKKSTTDL